MQDSKEYNRWLRFGNDSEKPIHLFFEPSATEVPMKPKEELYVYVQYADSFPLKISYYEDFIIVESYDFAVFESNGTKLLNLTDLDVTFPLS